MSDIYTPLSKQLEFHLSSKRFRAYVGGFGSGKTISGCMECIDLCLKNPGTLGVICRNTYGELTDTTMRTFFEILDSFPALVVGYNSTKHHLKLAGGSSILFRSLDRYEKFKSLEIGFFFIDEASDVVEDAFLILSGRLRNKYMINSRYTGLITSNPPDKRHWLYKRFVKDNNSDFFLVQASTLENPHLPEGYIESLRAIYPDKWIRVYVDGEFGFIPDGEPVFEEFDQDKHVKKVNVIPNLPIQIGLDFGYMHPAVVFTQKVGDNLFVLGELEGQKETIETFVEKIEKFKLDKFGRGFIYQYYGDPAGSQHNDKSERTTIEYLQTRGIFVKSRRESINNGLLIMRIMLHSQGNTPSKILIDESCEMLIKAFQGGYRYDTKRVLPDEKRKPFKDNVYDHLVDALRYLIVNDITFRGWLTKPKVNKPTTGTFNDWRKLGQKVGGIARTIRI